MIFIFMSLYYIYFVFFFLILLFKKFFFFSIMRCTLAKIPESNSLLQKSRLPLGIVIHPFRDINVSITRTLS